MAHSREGMDEGTFKKKRAAERCCSRPPWNQARSYPLPVLLGVYGVDGELRAGRMTYGAAFT